MSFTLTDDPKFLYFRCAFKQYFDDWRLSFKQQMVIFSKSEKNNITANM